MIWVGVTNPPYKWLKRNTFKRIKNANFATVVKAHFYESFTIAKCIKQK